MLLSDFEEEKVTWIVEQLEVVELVRCLGFIQKFIGDDILGDIVSIGKENTLELWTSFKTEKLLLYLFLKVSKVEDRKP